MPDNDRFRRYLEAGAAFTEMTRRKAEGIVRDLVRSGEISRDQATARVEDLLEHSRQTSEAALAVVRREIDARIAQLNLVSRDEFAALAALLGSAVPGGQSRRSRAAA